MIRALRDRLERRLPALTLLLLAIQPVLDVFSYFMQQRGSTAISTGLRFLLLVGVALLGFLLSDRKRVYLIFYGIALLFWVLHAGNCFRIGYRAPVSDAGNYLRILNFPIFTLSLMTLLQKGEAVRRRVVLGFAVALGEILLFTLLPWALGHPVYTYASLGVGMMGWFGVANAQSAIIVLVSPLAVYWAYETRKYPVFLAVSLLSFGLMYATGTKFTFYSILIITGAFAFLFFLQLKKKAWKYALPLLAVAVLVVGFRNQSPMALRQRMSDYSQSIYGSRVENSLESSGADEETLTLIRQGVNAAQTSEAKLERVRRSLLGVYTDPELYGPLLKDLYDRFGVYNVMNAYGYTAEPSRLSDSRARKGIFATMMWEEKDLPTRLLGFEYIDMLTETAIYDLENDFPAVFYFCGYLGFGLYLLFFAYFVWIVLRAFLREIRQAARERRDKPGNPVLRGLGSFGRGVERFLTLEMGAVGMTFLLAVIAAQLSGNVLRRPNVTVYFAAVAACLYQLTREKPEEEEEF